MSAVLRCKQTAEENWDGHIYHLFAHREELGGENLAETEEIPGWINRGEFKEIKIDNGKIIPA